MSNEDDIELHVEAIIAELIGGGLRDPAWIANAYIERIDPDRKLSDLVNGACAAYVQQVARRQLGIAEPEGPSNAKPAPVRKRVVQQLHNAADALRHHGDALRAWYESRKTD